MIKLSRRSAIYSGKMLHLIHFQLLLCLFHVPLTTVTTTATMKRCTLLKGPIRDLTKKSENSSRLRELKFMLKHMDRRKNEVTFRKCDDPLCQHCSSKPVHATAVFEFLRRKKYVLFEPLKSEKHPNHYCTFLGLYEKEPGDLESSTCLDMPSLISIELGKCEICPAYVFLSATEKKWHMTIFHPKKSAKLQKTSGSFITLKLVACLSHPSIV